LAQDIWPHAAPGRERPTSVPPSSARAREQAMPGMFRAVLGMVLCLAPSARGSSVVTLTDQDFHDKVNDGEGGQPWFLKFYAPWCGHCKKLVPEWDKLADMTAGQVNIADLDATVHSKIAKEFNVQGFPTLKLISGRKMYSYEGARRAEDMAAWAKGGFQKSSGENLPKDQGLFDNAIKALQEYMRSAMQVVNFIPSLLPLVFIVGFFFGILVAWMMGLASAEDARPPARPKKAVAKAAAKAEEKAQSDKDENEEDTKKEK